MGETAGGWATKKEGGGSAGERCLGNLRTEKRQQRRGREREGLLRLN